jgi:hypothetical protein
MTYEIAATTVSSAPARFEDVAAPHAGPAATGGFPLIPAIRAGLAWFPLVVFARGDRSLVCARGDSTGSSPSNSPRLSLNPAAGGFSIPLCEQRANAADIVRSHRSPKRPVVPIPKPSDFTSITAATSICFPHNGADRCGFIGKINPENFRNRLQ